MSSSSEPHTKGTENLNPSASGTTTLWRSQHVLSPTSPDANAIVTTGSDISWVGNAAEAPSTDSTVDLGETLITPAFVDSHAHITFTGVELTLPSLSKATSAEHFLDIVAEVASTLAADDVIILRGWDETTWADPALPTHEQLLRATGGRTYYFPRACGHIGIASAQLLRDHPELADLDGYDSSGVFRQKAHRAGLALLTASIGLPQRKEWSHTALTHAASLGIAAIVECSIATGDPYAEADFQQLIELGNQDYLPTVYGWWAELCQAEKARDLGAVGCGGDLNLDGSIGARTAALSAPYFDDESTSGNLYLTADDVHAHLLDCHRVGIPAGFHSIGDAATATIIDGFHKLAADIDVEDIRSLRHRIEHCELVDKDLIAGIVKYGLHASVQPSFDAAWGGTDKMYATRMGTERSLSANPLARLSGVGIPLAFGSDSPVTPLDPWGGVRAAVLLHNPTQRLGLATAFAAATRGGWRALGVDNAGAIMPSQKAHFAAWDISHSQLDNTSLPDVGDPDMPLPPCRATVANGNLIHQN